MERVIFYISVALAAVAVVLSFFVFTVRVFHSTHEGCRICGRTEAPFKATYVSRGEVKEYHFDEQHYAGRPERFGILQSTLVNMVTFISPLFIAFGMAASFFPGQNTHPLDKFTPLFFPLSAVLVLSGIILLNIYISIPMLLLLSFFAVFLFAISSMLITHKCYTIISKTHNP